MKVLLENNKFLGSAARVGLVEGFLSQDRGVSDSSHWRHCVVSLSKTHYSLLSGASQEDQSRHN